MLLEGGGKECESLPRISRSCLQGLWVGLGRRAKGNAHFFAKNLDKVGLPEADIRDAIISLIRKMQGSDLES